MESFCLICGKPIKIFPYMVKRGRGKLCSLVCKYKFMSKQLTGRIFTDQWKAKMRESRKRQVFSKEDRENMSRGQKKRFLNLEERAKAGAKNKGESSANWKGGVTTNLTFYNNQRRAKKRASGSHTLGEWENLKVQYNWTCPCCGRKEPDIKLTEDHVIPLSRGGSNNIENIQPLCHSCNCKKYTKVIKYNQAIINDYKE